MTSFIRSGVFALGLFCLASSSAHATPAYLSAFKNYYSSTGTAMGNCYSCTICHSSPVGAINNVTLYGTDWQTAWSTEESASSDGLPPGSSTTGVDANKAFADIETRDSDGDGSTNITEINATSNPSNASSKPGSTGCQSGSGTGTGTGSSNSGTATSASLNPYALSPSCGLIKGQSNDDQDPPDASQVAGYLFLIALPLLTLAYLKSSQNYAA